MGAHTLHLCYDVVFDGGLRRFNAVSFYVNWAVHYPMPDTNGGEGDFAEGTYRDIQRFIDEGKKAGLWLIARYVFRNVIPFYTLLILDADLDLTSVSGCFSMEGRTGG